MCGGLIINTTIKLSLLSKPKYDNNNFTMSALGIYGEANHPFTIKIMLSHTVYKCNKYYFIHTNLTDSQDHILYEFV